MTNFKFFMIFCALVSIAASLTIIAYRLGQLVGAIPL